MKKEMQTLGLVWGFGLLLAGGMSSARAAGEYWWFDRTDPLPAAGSTANLLPAWKAATSRGQVVATFFRAPDTLHEVAAIRGLFYLDEDPAQTGSVVDYQMDWGKYGVVVQDQQKFSSKPFDSALILSNGAPGLILEVKRRYSSGGKLLLVTILFSPGTVLPGGTNIALAMFIQKEQNTNAWDPRLVEWNNVPLANTPPDYYVDRSLAGVNPPPQPVPDYLVQNNLSSISGMMRYGLQVRALEPLDPLKLHVARNGSNVVVSWPGGLAGFYLEKSLSVNGPTWTRLYSLNGPASSFTNAILEPSLFFRMATP